MKISPFQRKNSKNTTVKHILLHFLLHIKYIFEPICLCLRNIFFNSVIPDSFILSLRAAAMLQHRRGMIKLCHHLAKSRPKPFSYLYQKHPDNDPFQDISVNCYCIFILNGRYSIFVFGIFLIFLHYANN